MVKDSQRLIVYPQIFSRGFYLKLCNQTRGNIQFRFIDYGSKIIKFEDSWLKDKKQPDCYVNRVRGAQNMEIIVAEKYTD